VVPSGAPELLDAFGLTPARAAGWTLVAYGVLAVLVEPPLLAAAHGRRARSFRTAGLALMALSTLAAALAPSYGVLLAALTIYGPASGLGTSLAEAALVSAQSGRTETVLARWSLAGALGDLVAPAALAASVALGLGWRGALIAAGLLAAVEAVLAAGAPGAAPDRDGADASLRDALRAAASSPQLAGWSLAAALCGLMDEVLVAFGALWLSGHVGADATQRAAILGAWVAGSIAGAALLARVAARVRPSTLLAASGAGCAVAYAAWLSATGWIASGIALGVAGAFAAAHHPLLRARAFETLPERPHVVLAAGSLFGTVELVLPLLVGLVADRGGVLAAMLVLLAQPIAVLAAGAVARRGERRGRRRHDLGAEMP
jgi:predicted MFS family arabinose efflux permease